MVLDSGYLLMWGVYRSSLDSNELLTDSSGQPRQCQTCVTCMIWNMDDYILLSKLDHNNQYKRHPGATVNNLALVANVSWHTTIDIYLKSYYPINFHESCSLKKYFWAPVHHVITWFGHDGNWLQSLALILGSWAWLYRAMKPEHWSHALAAAWSGVRCLF